MKVQQPTVGPILGATTTSAVRLWGRGAFESTPNGPRRCFGVVRVRPDTASRFRQPIFFKMNPNFDMTGVVLVDDLEANRAYEYQLGYVFSDLDLHTLPADTPLDWSDIPIIEFCTSSADSAQSRSFVFGSCRYLLRLFGGSWFDNRGDKTFRSILRQIDSGAETDLLLMVGDQIYADDLNFISPDSLLDEFNARYRDAFTQRYIRQLMAGTPTYMMLDDHEIEDAWPANASARDQVVKYPAAIHAYQSYQASHSPLLPMLDANHMVGVPQRFWYTVTDGCCDFFVADTRTERFLSDDPSERRIMSDEQFDALKQWLADGSGRVKFVVSSVPIFPDTVSKSDRLDKWSGFPQQRGELLDLILRDAIPRVVFLAGDYHMSVSAELVSPDKSTFRVLSVVSSAFYWPYPHGSQRRLQLEGMLPVFAEYKYQVVGRSPLHATDNFTRISANLAGLNIECFDRKGNRLSQVDYKF